MESELGRALVRIPLFAGMDGVLPRHERLGGLTNRVFKVWTPDEAVALRIPGVGTAEYIDRRAEAHNALVAAETGVSPEVLFFDEADGLMVTRFLGECTTMTGDLFRSRKGAASRAAIALQQLHGSARPFQARFELFEQIEGYLGHLRPRAIRLPEGYHDVLKESNQIRATLEARPVSLVPCHCDPLAENFLDDGTRMWIVDWEYAGMNDPLWDLGDLSVEAGFSDEQDRELLGAYFNGKLTPEQHGRFVIYKAMCDLLWTLWGLLQHANDNPAEDFWTYAIDRFERCQVQLSHPDFGRHLAAIR